MHGLPTTTEVDEHGAGSILGPVDHDSYAIQKHRKMSSTGGGRAWTEEEESYLLRTRSNKMPYKHIASHLHKTELACRLHFHQMSYGSNRRKRTGSMSSTCSSSSFNPLLGLRDTTPEHPSCNTLSTITSPPSSPESTASGLAPPNYESPAMPQRPILPKPVMSDMRPMLPTSDILNKTLRLDTSFTSRKEIPGRATHIDYPRLHTLYLTHRNTFWAQIASMYSPNAQVSAAELEDAFFATHQAHVAPRGSSPPTPGPSPQTISHPAARPVLTAEARSFSAINLPTRTESTVSTQSAGERCAVSGLLN